MSRVIVAVVVVHVTAFEMILTLVRHGESTGNVARLWAGTTDSPLTNHGHAQAVALGKLLKADEDSRISAIYCSDLIRAYLTARQIGDTTNIPFEIPSDLDSLALLSPPLIVTPLLREMDFGSSEGTKWNTTRAEDCETRQSIDERVQKIMDLIPKNGHVVIVSHGIFLSHLMRKLGARHSLHNTGWSRFEIENAKVKVLAANRIDHLGFKRKKGASWRYDEKQTNLKAFFSKQGG